MPIPSRKPRKVIRKLFQPGDPFGGELMTCFLCGKQERSNPHTESGWSLIVYGADSVYFCPNELPSDPASPEEYALAYERIFTALRKRFGHEA